METSQKKSRPLSQLIRMQDRLARTSFILSQHNIAHAFIGTHNQVPLCSSEFFTWVTRVLEDRGIYPSAGQLSHFIRILDGQTREAQIFRSVNHRIYQTAPKTYRIDLHNREMEVINLSADGWCIDDNYDSSFYTPDGTLPFLRPEPIKTKLPQCLEKLLHLPQEKAKQLSTWLVEALLPGNIVPALVITGTARYQAATKLRQLLDPMICPLLVMPSTTRRLGQVALTNRVMALSISGKLPPARIVALNDLRTGLQVDLKQVDRSSGPSSTLLQRPIILALEKEQNIHEGQLTIEVNETAMAEPADLLAALLDAAVEAIRETEEKEKEIIYFEKVRTEPESREWEPEQEGPYP